MKLSNRKNTSELMESLGLEEAVVKVVKRSGLRWMGYVLRREDDEPVKRVWDLEVDGILKRERKTEDYMEGCGKERKQ